ncbi:hypothetical protein QJS04_geneDACA023625 [Acorus gramineus]|uniref:Uncharacterized protein n=1 Tax=Acorus gramineus TaxID=55184 RepID=A0AAV9A059_ACOGR|nr:hypothetical protein QJS04_geneDACA023625 [Acorus gramineus]
MDWLVRVRIALDVAKGKPVYIVEAGLKAMHITEWVDTKFEMRDIVDQRLDGNYHKVSLQKAMDLAKKCTSLKSDSRPSMEYVMADLSVCWEIEKAHAMTLNSTGETSSSNVCSLGSNQSGETSSGMNFSR